jgi:hypothetical protein
LLAWFAYKFIVRVALPVYRVSRRMRQQMRDFQQMAQQQQQQHTSQSTNTNANANTSSPNEKVGEYIDFEEVKEK